MDPRLALLAASQGGVVMRQQALAAGFDDRELTRLRQRGSLVAIRRGAYVDGAAWRRMSLEEQHIALVHATVLRLAEPAVVSHSSAALLHGVPLWKLDLSTVHITREDQHSARTEAGICHHAAALPPGVLTSVDGIPLTSGARTVIDVARTSGYESSVVVADAVLRAGLASPQELLAILNAMRDYPGARNAGRVVEFADGRSESVGESRARVAFELAGLPRPELQVLIEDLNGYAIARVDFLFRKQRTIAEFDGRMKYGSRLAPGADPGEVVWREKLREDRLRERGYEIVRPIWADLSSPSQLAARMRAAFVRAERRQTFAA